MVLFLWTSEYEVGIPAIDNQHKKICYLANHLHGARETGQAADVIQGVVVELVNYTKDHFEFELRQLAALGHPGIAAHRKEHEALVSKVTHHALQLYDDPLRTANCVTHTLRDWLFDHIRDCDVVEFHQVGFRSIRAA